MPRLSDTEMDRVRIINLQWQDWSANEQRKDGPAVTEAAESLSARSLKVVDLYVIVTDDIVTNNIAKDKIVIDDIVTNDIVSHASKVSLLMSSSATNIATG
ncbi:unnamed protein product [Ceratitis capitata]|uniref:(Mediterranean fruit fly) hypothetical protein n=1 Tax=Ceratitis capitata TaxID=7213 RepID=A0A811V4K4_CERCA|nr:unnamed protein product [Ceratitis capitata]